MRKGHTSLERTEVTGIGGVCFERFLLYLGNVPQGSSIMARL